MANLSLSPSWNAGVYQLETTDPVQGGAGGIANQQAKQLGDRTEWLKQKVDSLISGNMQFRSIYTYSSNTNMTVDNNGGLVVLTGTTGITLTLADIADADALENGQAIVFKNKNTSSLCLLRTWPGDGSTFDDGIAINFPLLPEDVLMVIRKDDIYYTMHVRYRDVPAGTIITYAGTNTPDPILSGGYLQCNGAIVNRADYPHLFVAIGTTYNTGGETGTQFRLPDLRGEFIRGLDDGRGVDSGRVIGSNQSDLLKSHTHGINTVTVQSGSGATAALNDSGVATSNVTKATGGAETRPRNVAMRYLIKY